MKIIPISEYSFVRYPLTHKDFFANFAGKINNKIQYQNLMEKAFDINEEILREIGFTKKFDLKTNAILNMSVDEIELKERERQLMRENENKKNRIYYMDLYRKYQAAVNYGEIESNIMVETFIQALRDKDWSALEYVPDALMYFDGKSTFENSGLIKSIGKI